MDTKYWLFVAVQVGETVLQSPVFPFGLNIVPQVFTKMLKPVGRALFHLGIKILMHLNDWLIHKPQFVVSARFIGI